VYATQVHDVFEVPTDENVNPGCRSECNMKRVGSFILPHSAVTDVLGRQFLSLGI
jgi:hypothetical protein